MSYVSEKLVCVFAKKDFQKQYTDLLEDKIYVYLQGKFINYQIQI